MAKINQGILGGFSGSVANVVGSSWKGIAVMKAKPLSVSNPQTAGQVAQRNKFRAGSALSSTIKNEIIKPFWDRFASRMSGVNAWMSKNVQHYDSSGNPDLANLIMSEGQIGKQHMLTATYDSGTHTFTATWDTAALPSNGLPTDTMAAVAVAPSNTVYGITEAGLTVRSDGTIDITNDLGGLIEAGSYVYLLSMRPDGTVVSDSSAKLV